MNSFHHLSLRSVVDGAAGAIASFTIVLRFLQDAAQMIRSPEALRINLADTSV